MLYSSSLVVAAAAGMALAQSSELHTTTLTIGFVNSAGSSITTVTTYTYDFSNPQTSLLTETNSEGIITASGITNQPTPVTTQPAVVTTQPAVATSQPPAAIIPAGLPTGEHTVTVPISGSASFTTVSFSIGSSTTSFESVQPTTSSTPTTNGGSGSGSSGSGSGSGSGTSGTNTASSPASTSSNAAVGSFAPVSIGLFSLGTLFAALF